MIDDLGDIRDTNISRFIFTVRTAESYFVSNVDISITLET